MAIWNFLQTIAEIVLGHKSKTSKKKAKRTTQASRPVSKDRAAEPSSKTQQPVPKSNSKSSAGIKTPTAPVAPSTTNAKVKAPTAKAAPAKPQIETGARSTFIPATIDTAGIRCSCTPEVPSGDNADLFIDLGIDFGTRYTKVCFRDSDTNQTTIVTFDTGSASLEQALVLSQLAVLENGAILTGLTSQEWENSQWPIATTIDFIKMRLAYLDLPQENPHWPLPVDLLDSPETIENLSAYFLARLIARSCNWIQITNPDLFKNRQVVWILKMGVPVEYCQGAAIDRFEQVLKLAWALSFTPLVKGGGMVTLPQLNQCMGHVRDWVQQHPKLDCSAKPEIGAAVWSHIQAVGSREGFFVFFDVGEGTVEGASFRFYRDEGESKIDFYSGFVKPLGVAALVQQLADELGLDADTVRQHVLSWSAKSPNSVQTKILGSTTRRQLQQLVGHVVDGGRRLYRQVRPFAWKEEMGPQLAIFMGGGGGQIGFYKRTIKETHADFNHEIAAEIPPYKLLLVPKPKVLKMRNLSDRHFNRFAIAYGLSIQDGEFPEFNFPSDADKPNPPPRGPRPDNYDDSRGSW